LENSKERVLKYLELKGVSKREFYLSTGLSNGFLDKTNNIGADKMERILSAYPDMDLYYIVTGYGQPVVQESNKYAALKNLIVPDKSIPNSIVESIPNSIPNSENTPNLLEKSTPKYTPKFLSNRSNSEAPVIHFSSEKENYTPVPIIDLQVAAGGGYLNEDFIVNQAHIDMPNYFLKRGALYFWVKVRGDSMAPTIHDDSLVMIRLMDRGEWANLSKEVVCGVFTKEGVGYLKRIKNRLNKGFVTCMSDNPDKASNPNFNIEIDEIQTLWYAECFLSWRFINVHDQYYSRLQRLEDRFEDMVKLLNK